MQEVFLLQAIFGAAVVLTEIPSGYCADTWGRKKTLILGAIFCALGHTALFAAQGFWTLVIFELCLGVGSSLISGADIAILYDTKQALRCSVREQRTGVANLFFSRSVSEAASGVLCSILLLWSIHQVVLAQVLVGWLPLLFACLLKEPQVERLSTHSHMENFRQIAGALLSSGTLMRLIVLALSFWSLTTFYAVWLLQKYWENIGIPLVWFGYLWAIYAVLGGLAGRYAHWLEASLGAPLMIVLVGVLPILGYLGMVWTDTLLSLGFISAFFVARGLGLVALRGAFNQRLKAAYRATANSLASFAFRGGYVVTGPILGWMFDWWGMEVALYATAGFSLMILLGIMLPLALAVASFQATKKT